MCEGQESGIKNRESSNVTHLDSKFQIPDSHYFALLNLPLTFDLDQTALHRAYIQLQQRYHPDRFARASEAEKLAAMQASADANQAYTTLKDPLLRIEYLLGLQGIVLGDRPNAVKASQALLIESMEMRESLSDAQHAEDIAILRNLAQQQETRTLAQIQELFTAQDIPACAQAAIRLRFLRKFADEVKKAQ